MTKKRTRLKLQRAFEPGKNIRKKRAAVDEDTREIDIDTRSGNTNALNEIKGTCVGRPPNTKTNPSLGVNCVRAGRYIAECIFLSDNVEAQVTLQRLILELKAINIYTNNACAESFHPLAS